jgi:hypothetical protein
MLIGLTVGIEIAELFIVRNRLLDTDRVYSLPVTSEALDRNFPTALNFGYQPNLRWRRPCVAIAPFTGRIS